MFVKDIVTAQVRYRALEQKADGDTDEPHC